MTQTNVGQSARWRKYLSIAIICIIFISGMLSASGVFAQEQAEQVAPLVEKEINTGDNAWMLMSSALVLLMTAPGLAMFYGRFGSEEECPWNFDAVHLPDGPDDGHLGSGRLFTVIWARIVTLH